MSQSYLDTCREAAETIDVDRLAAMQLGNMAERGGEFEFRQLGRLSVGSIGEQYLGVKSARQISGLAFSRVMDEIAFIGLEVHHSPELASYMPSFVNLLRVEDSDAVAILTEDASEGGSKEVHGRRASPTVTEMLYEPFKEQGTIGEVMDRAELRGTVAFDVEGRERLLDFSPRPVKLEYVTESAAFEEYQRQTMLALSEVTITIPGSSVLGQGLNNLPVNDKGSNGV